MKKLYAVLILTFLVFGMPSMAYAQTDIAIASSEEPITSVSNVIKCGVNTFMVSNECGAGAFRNAYWQCYDGYEDKQGDDTSCKLSEIWQEYAEAACKGHCSNTKPVLKPTETVQSTTSSTGVSVCYISNELLKEYDELIVELQKVDSEGDKTKSEEITKKIIALKQEIAKNQENCKTNTISVTEKPATLTATQIYKIDRCKEITQWENKITYYKKLSGLSNSDLKEKTDFSREEINKILSELTAGLEKVRTQCNTQEDVAVTTGAYTTGSSAGGGGSGAITTSRIGLTETIKPVVADSGQEINTYYRARIEKITTVTDVDEQIKELKALREDIDKLIVELIKSREEINAAEIGGLTEIKISRGEIKANDVAITTTGKKILVDVGTKQLSMEPTETQVLIRDEDLKVTAEEISVKDATLMVGNSEVKLAASDVVDKLKISPKSIELKEENTKAVYKIKVDENRNLLGFIPIQVENSLTIDAANSEAGIIGEELPWWAFLTVK